MIISTSASQCAKQRLIFRGSIINVIKKRGVSSVVFDNHLNMFYDGLTDTVIQNSINGEKIELGGKSITALGFVGIDHRIMLGGCEDRAVAEVAADFLPGPLSVRREINISEYRIAQFITHRGTTVVDVLDGIGMKSIWK
jgi:hypothetical protein